MGLEAKMFIFSEIWIFSKFLANQMLVFKNKGKIFRFETKKTENSSKKISGSHHENSILRANSPKSAQMSRWKTLILAIRKLESATLKLLFFTLSALWRIGWDDVKWRADWKHENSNEKLITDKVITTVIRGTTMGWEKFGKNEKVQEFKITCYLWECK